MTWHPGHHNKPAPEEPPADDSVLHANLVGTLMLEGPKKYDPAILTDEVRLAIASAWPIMPCDKLIENRLVDIAYTLDEVLTDAMGYTNDRRYAVAEELVRYIRLMREDPAEPVAVAATAAAPVAADTDEAAEAAAMTRLLKMAEPTLEIRDNSGDTCQAVCRIAIVTDNSGHVFDIICLEGGQVTDNSGDVVLHCPYGVSIRRSDNTGHVKIKFHSNVALLGIALGYNQ